MPTDGDYQARVARHVALVTEGDPTDLAERRDRFGEESLELQQALGQTREAAHALVDYVYGRPVGEPGPELGGTAYTLAALAGQANLDLRACAEAELERISTPEMVARIRAKRATRHGRGPLPGTVNEVPPVPPAPPERAKPRRWGGMDLGEEGRIGCTIMMLGTALATLSSMTGLGMIGLVGTVQTLVVGVLVIAMVVAAGMVLVEGSRLVSTAALILGLAASAVGWAVVGHLFLWAFPACYAAFAALSFAFPKRPRPA